MLILNTLQEPEMHLQRKLGRNRGQNTEQTADNIPSNVAMRYIPPREEPAQTYNLPRCCLNHKIHITRPVRLKIFTVPQDEHLLLWRNQRSVRSFVDCDIIALDHLRILSLCTLATITSCVIFNETELTHQRPSVLDNGIVVHEKRRSV